jgi:hypothetical protein
VPEALTTSTAILKHSAEEDRPMAQEKKNWSFKPILTYT